MALVRTGVALDSELLKRFDRLIRSEGYACLCPDCPYLGVTAEAVHALVSDGQHGKGHAIQRWICQWCGHSYTARRGTLLFRLKKSSGK